MILLFPAVLVLPIVLFTVKLKKADVFGAIATGFLLLLPLGWKAALGVLNDWNLFAIVAIPGSILVWSVIVRNTEALKERFIIITMLVFSLLNTFSWVLSNHVN